MIRPLHVVMICLVVMTVAGGFLLISPAEPIAPVDGAIEWHEESPLRAVVQLLCLNYQVSTIYAGAIKNYILGLGSGLAILALTIAIVAGSRTREEDASFEDAVVTPPESNGPVAQAVAPKAHIAPLFAAQVLVGLYLLWSFASGRWSWAPELAVGGSILLTIHFLWAFALGHGLSSAAARVASRTIVAITVLTAVVAIWYHYGRNPTLRADFPLGNPSFLATCLIPGILLAAMLICERVAGTMKVRPRFALAAILAAVAMIGISLWAFVLAGARGPGIGLVFGALAIAFFALRGRIRWIPVVLALGVAVSGWMYFGARAEAFSPTGRSATVRLRTYAWSYAWRMFNERPFTGHGQGAFVLAGDSHVVDDVLDDPLVFESRIAHAHNEWLEVMADLGSVGIVLIAAAMLLTLRAGLGALAASLPSGQRWALIGLMGALVGLIVEECFGVGLRVSGVGTCFYTVLGLIWALSSSGTYRLTPRLAATRLGRIPIGVVGGLLGACVLVMTHQDFAAARSVHRAKEALAGGDFEEAVRLASSATNRLNPQRSLANLYRLGQAHLQAAQYLQDRAADRKRRAGETEPPNLRLLALAQEDYQLSDKHCEDGSGALNELVERSPSYINHGWLGYWLNLTRAGNAAARNDTDAEEALLRDAAVAIKRELLRQPFKPEIAADYVHIQRNKIESSPDFAEIMNVFARPLRHHRIGGAYVDLLAELAGDPTFDRRLEQLIEQAIRASMTPKTPAVDRQSALVQETWAPEKLRLAATVYFLRGDYQGARAALELAASAYDSLALSAPLGTASCYAELADCRFFSDPNDTTAALSAARRALTLAPRSRRGRLLTTSVKTRMIDYALAAGQEQEAGWLVSETGPGDLTEQDIRRVLGIRYCRMTESLLNRREAGGLLRKPPPAQLVPKFQHWVARAIALNPEDPIAQYLAADLAFHVGDDEATVMHLRNALDRGLSPDLAVQFIRTARDRRPDSKPLESLWESLVPSQPSEGPADGPPQPPETEALPSPPG